MNRLGLTISQPDHRPWRPFSLLSQLPPHLIERISVNRDCNYKFQLMVNENCDSFVNQPTIRVKLTSSLLESGSLKL